MKTSVIKDIFNGFKGHIETMSMPKEGREHIKTVCETYDELEHKLSPELLELYKKHTDALEGDWNEQVDFYFVEGFKLGLRIGVECMEE